MFVKFVPVHQVKGLSSSALKTQLRRKTYHLERNTEQNPEQLLLA